MGNKTGKMSSNFLTKNPSPILLHSNEGFDAEQKKNVLAVREPKKIVLNFFKYLRPSFRKLQRFDRGAQLLSQCNGTTLPNIPNASQHLLILVNQNSFPLFFPLTLIGHVLDQRISGAPIVCSKKNLHQGEFLIFGQSHLNILERILLCLFNSLGRTCSQKNNQPNMKTQELEENTFQNRLFSNKTVQNSLLLFCNLCSINIRRQQQGINGCKFNRAFRMKSMREVTITDISSLPLVRRNAITFIKWPQSWKDKT